MHATRLVCFVLGIWLAGGLFMAWVATQNFRSVDRLLEEPNPAARLDIKTLDSAAPGAARLFLRYQVSEQNRFYFESWELAQIVIGSLLFFFLLFGTREDKVVLGGVLLLVLLVLAQRFFLTPEIVARGRALDFLAPTAESAERSRFWLFHNLYSGVELAKWAVTFLIAVRLVVGRRGKSSRERIRQKVDVVDKADHRHINR